ncbi:MAG: hypothetical protein LBH31_05095 [Burkholderiaceae bacterium]|jgi:hypothetical protein|nr:hypothetical protein [Burkholderiaceae bacterium]
MCIIITGTAHNLRCVLLNTPGLIESIYDHNPHGLGLMTYDAGQSRAIAHKTLPKSAHQAWLFLQEKLPHDGRQAAVHARLTTHGATDLDNCHPYRIGDGWLMHNGMLDSGNAADRRKSDTWHYIRNYLGHDGSLLLTPHGRRLVSEHIGPGNRFVYLAPTGNMVTVNKHTGVKYQKLWFSNTYAWDVQLLDPAWETRRKFRCFDGYEDFDYRDYKTFDYGGYGDYEEEDGFAFIELRRYGGHDAPSGPPCCDA